MFKQLFSNHYRKQKTHKNSICADLWGEFPLILVKIKTSLNFSLMRFLMWYAWPKISWRPFHVVTCFTAVGWVSEVLHRCSWWKVFEYFQTRSRNANVYLYKISGHALLLVCIITKLCLMWKARFAYSLCRKSHTKAIFFFSSLNTFVLKKPLWIRKNVWLSTF